MGRGGEFVDDMLGGCEGKDVYVGLLCILTTVLSMHFRGCPLCHDPGKPAGARRRGHDR